MNPYPDTLLTGLFFFFFDALGQKKPAASAPKAVVATSKRSVRPVDPVVEEAEDEVPQEDDTGNAAEADGDVGDVPAAMAASGKKMLNSAGRQVSGLAGTAAESAQLVSAIVESFNSLLQDNIRNVQRMVEFKKGMLSSLSRALTNGAIDLMRNAQEIGGEGGRVASGLLRNTSKTTKEALKMGGVLANAPIQMASDGLKVGRRVVAIPAKTTNVLSKAVSGAFSVAGIHSEEADADRGQANETEDVEVITPPKQKAAAKKGGGTRK